MVSGQGEPMVVYHRLPSDENYVLSTETTIETGSEPLVSSQASNQVPLDYKSASVTAHSGGDTLIYFFLICSTYRSREID